MIFDMSCTLAGAGHTIEVGLHIVTLWYICEMAGWPMYNSVIQCYTHKQSYFTYG